MKVSQRRRVIQTKTNYCSGFIALGSVRTYFTSSGASLELETSNGMSNTRALVYGWYFQSNVGDDLFMDAYRNLFPDFTFTFTTRITNEQLKNCDVVFFGGGSFLYADVKCQDKNKLLKKPIFYVGVGIDDVVHPTHVELLNIAKVVAVRSEPSLKVAKTYSDNAMLIPDIVFSLHDQVETEEIIEKSVLILPNICVVPKWNDQNWKHASWNYFKSEFSQFLDVLVEDGYKVNLFAMCKNDSMHDDLASSEIVSQMKHRHHSYVSKDSNDDFSSITRLFSRHQHIISQRFHGIVLADLVKKNPVTVSHHSKLNYDGTTNYNLSYYNGSKQAFIDTFEKTKSSYVGNKIDLESFIVMRRRVLDAL